MDVWVSKAHSFRRKTLQKTTRFALLYTKNTTSKNFTVKRLLSTLCSVITRRIIPKLLQFGSNYPKNLLNTHRNSTLVLERNFDIIVIVITLTLYIKH